MNNFPFNFSCIDSCVINSNNNATALTQEKDLNGKLCFYYPFKIKRLDLFKTFLKRWKKIEKRQHNITKYGHLPTTTELIDRIDFTTEKEQLLRAVQTRIPGAYIIDICSPYATPCLRTEYNYSREDSLSTKVVSVIISHFTMAINKLNCVGKLIFNINLDSLIATTVVLLNFEGLSVDDVILLKHCFYKRACVSIRECDMCETLHNNNANHKCSQDAQSIITTITQFVYDKTPWLNNAQKQMDCRARHSLLEIAEPKHRLSKAQIKGLLSADEGYRYARFCNRLRNVSSRNPFAFYLSGGNGLIITNCPCYHQYKLKKRDFNSQISILPEHKCLTNDCEESCIPAIGKRYFPAFLKSVEVAYLIDNVKTNEISPKLKSYVNPFIIVRRCYNLWKIIHEVDINNHHTSNDINNSFGNTTNIAEIRTEYRNLLAHALNYLLAIVAILTLIVTIISVCK